jgi:hypothetical protein
MKRTKKIVFLKSRKIFNQTLTTNECSVTILVTIKYKSANTAAQETSRHIECKDLILHIGHGT